MANYDIVGNIVIVKFDRNEKLRDKRKWALKLLGEHKSVKTVLEKAEKFKGRLRVQRTKYVIGEKTKEVLYRENGCVFRFNVDTCYFSPRLASERKEIALKVKKGDRVLVMFSGVGVYGIVISKLSKAGKIFCVEISRECNKYAKENVKRNKLDNVEIVQGDVRRVIGAGKKVNWKFDRIVMARPNLKDSFLDVAFNVIGKGGEIYYYGFYDESEVEEMKELIFDKARKARKKIRILNVKKAGEVGVRRFRYRVDLKVLN